MNVFNFNKSYKALTTALFVLSIVILLLTHLNNKGTIPMVLFGIFSVMMFLYMAHAWASKLWFEGNYVYTRTIGRVRSLNLAEVDSITMMKMKGRYLFFLMSQTGYIMVSTIYENFAEIKEGIGQRVAPEVFKEMAVGTEDVAAANKRLNITLFVIFVVYAALAVYFNYFK